MQISFFLIKKRKKRIINCSCHLINDRIFFIVFARRCSPGCVYTMAMLKDAIGNSIRCTRHNVEKANTQQIAAAAVLQLHMNHNNNDVDNI